MSPSRSTPLAILLPPSEGKALGGGAPPWSVDSGRFGTALAEARQQVVDALVTAGGGDRALLGVGGDHLERAMVANRLLLGAPTLPASQRYTGVVYDHLDLASLPPAARRKAADAIVIVSGLLGLAGIDDPVPDYRLKMSVVLRPLASGRVSAWWRPVLTAVLDEWLAGRDVVDLLPGEHAAAWAPHPDRYRRLLRVRFVERDGKVAGHDAKAAKGLLVRHLLTSRRTVDGALATFEHPRFLLDVTQEPGR